MGATAFIVIMIAMLIGGIIWAIISTICLFISKRWKRSEKKYGKIIASISKIVLVGSIISIVIPVVFFSFIVFVNTVPPMEYVETDIIIEEDGYQDEQFTADGVVYEVLDLEPNSYVIEELSTPVFSYKTTGFLKGAQCGNYYRVKNGHDFELIWDGSYLLFCIQGEKEKIESFYKNEELSEWYMYEYEADKKIKISGEEEQALNSFVQYDISDIPETRIFSNDYPEGIAEFDVIRLSSDEIVMRDYYDFAIVEDTAYLINVIYDDEETGEYYDATKLPDEIGKTLLKLGKK